MSLRRTSLPLEHRPCSLLGRVSEPCRHPPETREVGDPYTGRTVKILTGGCRCAGWYRGVLPGDPRSPTRLLQPVKVTSVLETLLFPWFLRTCLPAPVVVPVALLTSP